MTSAFALDAVTLNSSPTFCGFSPNIIPYQRDVLNLIRRFDYSKSNLEILLSGAYGSAKSTLMAHVVVKHCVENPGARAAIGRRAMPDLKRTLWRDILDHMAEDFVEGVDYWLNRSSHTITFRNRAEIICVSWADKLYAKFRSLKLSLIAFEEIVENGEDDFEAFKQLKARLRRLPHIRENVLISATNPGAPSSWVYKYFIEGTKLYESRKVFYSRTEDNPFIDRAYVNQLRQDLSPKEAERYLEGKWVEISGEVVYFEYNSSLQYLRLPYTINPAHPVVISWDFNIGEGKPMSACVLQYINGEFHFFDEAIVFGGRTADTIDELDGKGLLRKDLTYQICGDASGRNRDTRSSKSDYEIIVNEFKKRDLKFEYLVPTHNPPVRTRHNRVNAYCKNAAGVTRLWVYEKAKTLDEGFRLVKLLKGANYTEDDKPHYQHVTTAAGYAVISLLAREQRGDTRTIQL